MLLCRSLRASSSWPLQMRSGQAPTLKEAMEQEVQEQVGLPPSQSAAKSGSGHDQKSH